jgi:hypothetical protein
MKILDFNNIKNLKFNSKINFINSSISYEMKVIASIANVSKKILEIGSKNAINTLLFSMNSSDKTSISLLTLNEKLIQRAYQYNDQNTEIFSKEDNVENSCEDLLFDEISYNSKIIFLERDFFKNEHLNFKNNFDLIFLDFENFSDILIDSAQFLIDLLSKEGALLVKGPLNSSSDFTDLISYKKNIFKIKDTSLLFIKN